MSITRCLSKIEKAGIGLPADEKQILLATIERYKADGMEPNAAALAAVRDALGDARSERAEIDAQIEKQLPKEKTAPTELKKSGDFYVAEGADAERIAKGLGVTLTSRNGKPYAGIPTYNAEDRRAELETLGFAFPETEKPAANAQSEGADVSPGETWDSMPVSQRAKLLDAYMGVGETDAPQRYSGRKWSSFSPGEQMTLTTIVRGAVAQPIDAHKEQGSAPEPITPPVIAEAIDKAPSVGVEKETARTKLLKEIEKAIAEAPEIEGLPVKRKNMVEQETKDYYAAYQKIPIIEFRVPGDGVFKVRNTTANLEAFLKRVKSSPGFSETALKKVAKKKPITLQNAVENSDSGVVATTGNFDAEGDRKFYVTMVRDDRVARLAGPFDTQGEAAETVSSARMEAFRVDPSSSFDAFGVSAITSKDHKPGSLNKALGIGVAPVVKDPSVVSPAPETKTPIVDRHIVVMDAVRAGTASLEDYRSSFAAVESNEEAIKAELAKKTKEELLKSGGAAFFYRHKGDTKPEIIRVFYNDMINEYALGKSYTKGGFVMMTVAGIAEREKNKRKTLVALVEAQTAEDLSEFAKEVAETRAEFKLKREARAEAIANPKTLDDFRAILREHVGAGKTRKEALLMMTPEQRVKYDELEAEGTRSEREDRKKALKPAIKTAGQKVDAQIIATKHTQKGHDLFVVRMAERVSREDYETLNSSAKQMGGNYSSFRGNGAVPGFQFRDNPTAEAFVKLVNGDASDAQGIVEQRRDAFEDDRGQSVVERLRTMADKLTENAEEIENADRKTNTARRARFAGSALRMAAEGKAKAQTMRNIASAIEGGTAKFLDEVRTKTQVDMLSELVKTAKNNELRAKYQSYADQEKRAGEPPTAETADYSEFPSYTAYRSDIASLGRQLLEVDGTKKLGQQIMKVADDVTDAYLDFAKANILKVRTFSNVSDASVATFPTADTADRAIKRSGYKGKAIAMQIKRGQYTVILSPSEAINRGIWKGDGDKRITFTAEFGKELVDAIGRRGNKQNRLTVPWQFQNSYDRLKLLARIGIETASEYRSALREFIALKKEAVADKVKEMELAMVGRKADGLDFFPTPAEIADQMVEAAELTPEMSVLEPSAGMGHLADRIRAAGAEPDVIEVSADRRELLQEKGYHLAEVNDFMNMEPRKFYTYGDVFRAPDGREGIMRGLGGMGSQRVRLEDDKGNRLGIYDRDELKGIGLLGSWSGYDRIIMNPPFSNRRDAEHVRHAYELLKPGGRIVAIMGEGVFFGSDKKAVEFRQWFDEVGGTDEKLPPGSFLDPSLPVNTGVNARMVVIEKPANIKFSKAVVGDQVNTPAFKSWFGDSKVVDAQGKPLVVYHGTGAEFNEFDLRKTGSNYYQGQHAFFFTSEKSSADNYATIAARGDGSPATMAVYLSLQNPLIVKASDRFAAVEHYDDNISANIFSYQADGYDGVVIKYDKGVFAVAFNPEQIKSATGNTGTFDPNNPDIRASKGETKLNAGMDRTALLDAIAPIIDKWNTSIAPEVTVVQSSKDLPQSIRNARGFDGSVEAATSGNKIYLVADRFSSLARAQAVLAHEAVGHYGIEAILGKDGFAQVAAQVITLRDSGAMPELFAEINARYGSLDDLTFASEAIAVMAEKGVKNTIMGRVMAAVRKFLRDLGFDLQLSETDLRAMIASAARYLQDGDARAPKNAMPQFSKEDLILSNPAFNSFFDGSKVVNSDGSPLVVFHGSPDVRGMFSQGMKSSLRNAFFAAADYQVANSYANEKQAWDYQNSEPGVVPLYLAIKNPMIIDAGGKHWKGTEKFVDEARELGHDGIIIKNSVDFHTNNSSSKPTTVYAWFSPTQAKSALKSNLTTRVVNGSVRKQDVQGSDKIPGATPNNGEFSQSDPRIAFSKIESFEDTVAYAEEIPFDAAMWADLTANLRKDSTEDAQKQWEAKGTDSEFFKRWFGDSKAVTKGGKPIKLYHGTSGNFFAFTRADGTSSGQTASGLGIFTTTQRDTAELYGDRVIDLYAKIEKPYRMGEKESMSFASVDESIARREVLQRLGYDGVYMTHMDAWVAFDPKQLKSATANRGTFAASNPDIRFSKMKPAEAFDSVAAGIKQAVTGMPIKTAKEWAGNKFEDWRPAMLGAFTMRQLSEMFKGYAPKVERYVDQVTDLNTRRNVLRSETAPVAQKWEQMQRADKINGRKMNELMHDSTLAGVDGAEAFKPMVVTLSNGEAVAVNALSVPAAIKRIEALKEGAPDAKKSLLNKDIANLRAMLKLEPERKAAYPALKARFDALPEPFQKLYVEVREAHDKRSEQYLSAILARVGALEVDAKTKTELMFRMRANFENNKVQGPYFPLSRFGDYTVAAEKPDGEGGIDRVFAMRDTMAEQTTVANELIAQGYTVKRGRKIENARAIDGASGTFVAEVVELMAKNGVASSVQDDIYQLYLRSLPDLSTRKNNIHRKGTKGYSEDALRAFAGNMDHGAYQLARLEHTHKLESTLRGILADANELKSDPELGNKSLALYGEMQKRHEFVMNPKNAAWVNKASSANFVFYLGISPAAALVNLTQNALMTYPTLAAKYGFVKAAKMLFGTASKAALLMSNSAVKWAGSKITGKPVPEGGAYADTLAGEDAAAYKALVDMGAIDVTLAHDQAGIADGSTDEYNWRARKAMAAVSAFFHAAEVVNRESAGIAAFRLAREAGPNRMSFQEAVKYAADIINTTHFDYSNTNRARMMQGDFQKLFFAFKQYSQNTTFFLWRSFYKGIWNSKEFTKQEKNEARKQLAGVLGMSTLFSGVLGLPLMSTVFGIANIMASMFGDDDEPWDAETEFKNFLHDYLGDGFIGNAAQRGAIESGIEALGLPAPAIAERVKLDQLWYRDSDTELTAQERYIYLLKTAVGPIGGIAEALFKSAGLFGEGEIWRSVETAMPKAVRDALKTARYAKEGVQTVRGDTLLEDVGIGAAVLQGLGFSPAEVGQIYDRSNAYKNYEEAIAKRRDDLLDGYALMINQGDQEGVQAFIAKITAFNAKHPSAAINARSLRQSMMARARYTAQFQDGVRLNPKLADETRERVRF